MDHPGGARSAGPGWMVEGPLEGCRRSNRHCRQPASPPRRAVHSRHRRPPPGGAGTTGRGFRSQANRALSSMRKKSSAEAATASGAPGCRPGAPGGVPRRRPGGPGAAGAGRGPRCCPGSSTRRKSRIGPAARAAERRQPRLQGAGRLGVDLPGGSGQDPPTRLNDLELEVERRADAVARALVATFLTLPTLTPLADRRHCHQKTPRERVACRAGPAGTGAGAAACSSRRADEVSLTGSGRKSDPGAGGRHSPVPVAPSPRGGLVPPLPFQESRRRIRSRQGRVSPALARSLLYRPGSPRTALKGNARSGRRRWVWEGGPWFAGEVGGLHGVEVQVGRQ